MAVTMTNSKDIVANTISVIDKDKVIDLNALFLSNLDAIHTIVGLPIDTLNSLQKLAEAINSDANFLNTIMNAINLKSDLIYVDTQLDTIITMFFKYDTTDASTIKFLTKSNKVETYNKNKTNLIFSSLIGGAPEVLNSIMKLAIALGNDQNYVQLFKIKLIIKATK